MFDGSIQNHIFKKINFFSKSKKYNNKILKKKKKNSYISLEPQMRSGVLLGISISCFPQFSHQLARPTTAAMNRVHETTTFNLKFFTQRRRYKTRMENTTDRCENKSLQPILADFL